LHHCHHNSLHMITSPTTWRLLHKPSSLWLLFITTMSAQTHPNIGRIYCTSVMPKATLPCPFFLQSKQWHNLADFHQFHKLFGLRITNYSSTFSNTKKKLPAFSFVQPIWNLSPTLPTLLLKTRLNSMT
jgi:hypothetical protein